MERWPISAWLCIFLLAHSCLPSHAAFLRKRGSPGRSFSIQGRDFILEDHGVRQPVQIHAGEVHYFRVPEVHWEDRLTRLAAMGLNAVSTYVPWNWHEQREGVFDFASDRKNLTKYIQTAAKLGLLVILRPGPYICAEWDLGGLPAWLLRYSLKDNMKFRTSDPQYLDFVDRWWSALLPTVRPLLVEEGGPVAMVQLENEFGHFGNASGPEKAYFDRLQTVARRHLGPRTLLITTDAGGHNSAQLGTAPGTFAAINLGPWYEPHHHMTGLFREADQYNGGGPTLIMELWSGWFQTWEKSDFTERHFRQPGKDLMRYVNALLERNASFTLYMAHGGTNFGFWNSATGLMPQGNHLLRNSFITTSYDYAAPISEEGLHGRGGDGLDKYAALRFLLGRRRGSWEPPLPPEPAPPVLAAYAGDGPGGAVRLGRRVPLRDEAVLAALCEGGWRAEPSGLPTPMELHGQQAGLALYRFRPSDAAALLRASEEDGSFLAGSQEAQARGVLKLKARDRITIWSAGNLLKQAQNSTNYGARGKLGLVQVVVPMGKHHQNATHLDILVEHLGRRAFVKRRTGSFDPESYEDWKGLKEAWLGGHKLEGDWQFCGLPLADLYAFNGSVPEPSTESAVEGATGPSFFQGSFSVTSEPADTFLRLEAGAWRTGAAYVNGFNLGRYHRDARGPFDFYVPKSAVRKGSNAVVLLEMDPPQSMSLAGAVVTLDATRGPMLRESAPGL